ncbi:MAG: FAD:protein FMN transferase, partial [Verrucomicrobiota bacterium]|nr:FAD:protein FMN transferase [Verrucomicrobiota bacterium]
VRPNTTPVDQKISEVEKLYKIKKASIATTANDQRGYWVKGKRVAHIIDPNTRKPVEGTVISNGTEEGEALATALFVMGPERSMEIARRHGAQTLILDAKGRILKKTTRFH